MVFYESTGGVIKTLEGSLKPEMLSFEYEPAEVEGIPHGAGFELFVTPDDTGIPVMVRYGTVTRREVRFPDAPAIDVSDTALMYGDKFNRSFLGPRWIVKQGKPKITDGAVGAAQQLFNTQERAALLFFAPLNFDDCTINCTFKEAAGGSAAMVFCSDYNMSSYLAFMVEEDNTDKVHISRGTSPTSITHLATVNSPVEGSQNYVIKFNSQANSVQVFKDSATTPLISWTDTTNLIPHGEGFRYLGMRFWTNAILSNGPRINEWSAKDGI